ncbi:reverse transcriptase domain-containing protein [Tanacetum coccineum]
MKASSFPFSCRTTAVVEPLTIEINAAGHDIHRMYIDGGASADILYEHCFKRLRPEVKSQLNPATTSLTGFTGEKIWPMGQLRLPVMVGNKEHSTTAWMNFMVIRSPSPYNGIIGRPGISAIRAVPSTAHGMLKFPVDGGIVTIYNTAAPPKECNTVTCDVTQTQRQHATKVTNLKVAIHPDYPEQEVSIGGSLSDTGRAAVCALLQRNLDIFAWEPKHMTGVPRSITEHKLKIRQGYSPVRQKKRGQAPERAKAILEEVSVPIQVRRHALPLFKTLKKCNEEGRLPLDYRSRRSFHAAQAAYSSTSHAGQSLTRPGRELIMYLSATHGAISAVLLTDRNSVQTPVYFVNPTRARAVKGPDIWLNSHRKPETDAVLTQAKVNHPEPWILIHDGSSCRVPTHVLGEYVAKEDNMVQYLDKTKSLIQGFDRFTIRQVPRGDNKKADALSKIASTSFAHLSKQVLVEILKNKSISEMEISTVIEEQDPTWMTPIVEFISKGTLPHEQKDARRIRRIAQRFELRDGVLYRRSMHSGPRSVVARALRSGYYWPTMHRDARDMIKKCNDCQTTLLNGSRRKRSPQSQGIRWVEELSHVLWAHRTTIKVSTGDTPFSLVYGTEAVIPAEIGMPTIRTAEVNITTNDDERRIDLDILEERREQAAIREEKVKLKMKGYYDAKVRGVSFRPGDFVYRANDASHAEDTGKLGPKWEGPYEVTEALGKGAYKLRDMDGRELPRTWNICHLKKCYL